MSKPTFRLVGTAEMNRTLQKLAKDFPGKAGRALRAEGEIEMAEAKRRTPVDTGALRSSGHVDGPRVSGTSVSVSLSFGGPSTPYALKVHEDLNAFHRVGQAKFLESTLNESAPHLAKRVAARLKL